MQDMVGGDNNRTPAVFQMSDIYRIVGEIKGFEWYIFTVVGIRAFGDQYLDHDQPVAFFTFPHHLYAPMPLVALKEIHGAIIY